ncbi:hypothetical protein [Stieleria varia]|uniref:hypothetical protein n=1 Tax=Stieleria varia TaxID=2528005 RepID=UPI001E532EF8|nr:hypothetical protein [Stieleria varia]
MVVDLGFASQILHGRDVLLCLGRIVKVRLFPLGQAECDRLFGTGSAADRRECDEAQ